MKLNPSVERKNSLQDTLAEPETSPISTDLLHQVWFTRDVLEIVTKDNWPAILTYVSRPEFSTALELYVLVAVSSKDPSYCDTPAFVKWAKTNGALKF